MVRHSQDIIKVEDEHDMNFLRGQIITERVPNFQENFIIHSSQRINIDGDMHLIRQLWRFGEISQDQDFVMPMFTDIHEGLVGFRRLIGMQEFRAVTTARHQVRAGNMGELNDRRTAGRTMRTTARRNQQRDVSFRSLITRYMINPNLILQSCNALPQMNKKVKDLQQVIRNNVNQYCSIIKGYPFVYHSVRDGIYNNTSWYQAEKVKIRREKTPTVISKPQVSESYSHLRHHCSLILDYEVKALQKHRQRNTTI